MKYALLTLIHWVAIYPSLKQIGPRWKEAKCCKEYNTVTRGLEPKPFDPESCAITTTLPYLPFDLSVKNTLLTHTRPAWSTFLSQPGGMSIWGSANWFKNLTSSTWWRYLERKKHICFGMKIKYTKMTGRRQIWLNIYNYKNCGKLITSQTDLVRFWSLKLLALTSGSGNSNGPQAEKQRRKSHMTITGWYFYRTNVHINALFLLWDAISLRSPQTILEILI